MVPTHISSCWRRTDHRWNLLSLSVPRHTHGTHPPRSFPHPEEPPAPNILRKSPLFPLHTEESSSPIPEDPAPLPEGVPSSADPSLITLRGEETQSTRSPRPPLSKGGSCPPLLSPSGVSRGHQAGNGHRRLIFPRAGTASQTSCPRARAHAPSSRCRGARPLASAHYTPRPPPRSTRPLLSAPPCLARQARASPAPASRRWASGSRLRGFGRPGPEPATLPLQPTQPGQRAGAAATTPSPFKFSAIFPHG